jgi:O-antigen ligase
MVREVRLPGAHTVAWLYGTWLFGINFVFHISDESTNALELALVAGVIPATLQLATLRLDTLGWSRLFYYSWAFLLVICAGYTYAIHAWVELVYLLNLAFVFAIATLIAGCEDDSLLVRMCSTYAIMSAPFLLYINLTGEYRWGRLVAGHESNVWGLIALSVGVAAFGIQNHRIAAACWIVALVTLYNASSRGSMVGFCLAAMLFLWYWLFHARAFHVSWRVVAAMSAVVVMAYLMFSFGDLILENVFRINEPDRGLSSGFTGRDQAWSEAVNVWLSAPILGVGFRKHEELMVVTRLSAHNAYLAMLADTGVVGLTLYLALIVRAAVSAMRMIGPQALRYIILAIIGSYAVLGFFERRALNTGNAFSILFIIAC